MVEIKRLKGTRDYEPEKAEMLFNIIKAGRKIFSKYGFLPLDTSSLERWETLISKDVNAGEEIKRQTYNFKDIGGKHIGLRYDLTISLIRYVVEHKNLILPFKRYQIGKVYRYEEAKRSRYREFYQFDLDVIGGKSFLYDAELLKIANEFFDELGIKNHVTLINNRKFAYTFINKKLGVKEENIPNVMRIIDKIDKITYEEFAESMKKFVSLPIKDIKDIYALLKEEFYNAKDFSSAFGVNEEELIVLEDALKSMNVKNYAFSMKIVRGLGYYTSNVFETFIRDYKQIGSIGGGGRYDNVFDKILKMHIPCVGYSFGVDRIIDYLTAKNSKRALLDVYIGYVSEENIKDAIYIRDVLKNAGLRACVIYDHKSLTNQIRHADRLKIEHFIIVGKRDLEKGMVTYRNLRTGEERKIGIKELKVLKDVVCRN